MSESQGLSKFKKFDIFALPFQFTLGDNEKEKKTVVGGLISLAILIVSSFYFGYLCYLYSQNKIQPQIVSTNFYQSSPYGIQFSQNFLSFKIIMANGQNLYDYQKSTGKVYLNLLSSHLTNGQTFDFPTYPLIPCSDDQLSGYMCLDSSKVGDGDNLFSFKYNPDNQEENVYSIYFGICDSSNIQSPYTCEDEKIIRETIITYSTFITMRIALEQFNTEKQIIQQRIVNEQFYFDTQLGFYSKIYFQNTDLTQQQGFILQSSEYSTYLSGFTRKDIFSSQEMIKKELKRNLLGSIDFFMGPESINLNIQYAQFTSLLAQFTSVFNSLLFVGIISKFFAESEIFNQIAEMQLKVYFKKSALFILQQIGQGENVQTEQQKGLDKLLNYIKNADFKNLGKQMKISLTRKIMYVFLGKIDKEEKESIQVKMFKQIVSQSNRALNIFEIQKEILQMKIMMRLILSVEQYAAIQLCGSKLPINNDEQQEQEQQMIEGVKEEESQVDNQIVSQDQKLERSMVLKEDIENLKEKGLNGNLQIDKDKQESIRKFTSTIYPISIEQQVFGKKNLNLQTRLISHLEKIDMIDRDELFFKECLDKFLEKQQQPQSEIDKRIRECMIGLDDLK